MKQIDIAVSAVENDEKHYRFNNLDRILSGFDDLLFDGPARAEIRVYRNREEIYLYGSVRASVILACDRCLDDSIHHIDRRFMYLLKPLCRRDELPCEMEITEDDIETSWYDGETIDIKSMLAEQLRLEIPLSHVCKDECKGLCPDCGCNLNLEKCNCVREDMAGPFAVLKELVGQTH